MNRESGSGERADALQALVGYLTGPTAAGKTEAALLLAQRRGWAILSVDSRQIYRRLELGTAKPTPRERSRVEHLLVDVLDPRDACSAGSFRRLAIQALKGRPASSVLAVGGAGLYWEALTRDLHPLPQADPKIRARHQAIVEAEGVEGLYRRLREVDEVTAARLSPNDRQRISRALEVAELTGQPMSRLLAAPRPQARNASVGHPTAFPEPQNGTGPQADTSPQTGSGTQRNHGQAQDPEKTPPVAAIIRPRDELYARIEERCRRMLESGLVEEVRDLLAGGLPPDAPGLLTVGYREFVPHLIRGEPLQACVEAFVRNSRRYAKRQETWLRNRTPNVHFLPVKQGDDPEEVAERIGRVLG